ncbi:hypothetical protein [Microbulbifer yueqingensis]|uniref:Uncharacterized protein n=1 Tax=Microbulbifer yueqingensis TaxID=658219 RepID=A0A1G9DR33_9GAMM|nr:hypothetical protein [Microbulbifer yueqingensis]SDK66369.1 hypothetical protein SAMN05216212_2924 [Microbulbifer yueqingensis]
MLQITRPIVISCLLFISGCVSIPPEAPELSAELGKRISAIEKANITLLNRFFDQKRRDVDRFIEDEWTPAFAENVFSQPGVAAAWDHIVHTDNQHERLKFLTITGPKLQKKINQKRLELIQPLDELERRMEGQIREEYHQARSINSTLTSFLTSASEVAENRNRYLSMLDIEQSQLDNLLDQTDTVVSDLLRKASDGKDKYARADEFIQRIQDLKSSL